MNNLYSSWPVVYILSYLIFSPLLSPSFSVSLIFEDYNCTYVWLLDVAWWVYSIHCLKIFCFLFCSSGRIISVALCPSSRSSLASPLNLLRPCEGYLISFRILYFLILEYLLAFLMAYIPQRFSICCFFFFFMAIFPFKSKHFRNSCFEGLVFYFQLQHLSNFRFGYYWSFIFLSNGPIFLLVLTVSILLCFGVWGIVNITS